MNSLQKLSSKNLQGKFVCVGLDTDINKIPKHLLKEKEAVLLFNKQIIEETYNLAAAYKINFAFYEDKGSKGFDLLLETLKLIPSDILTIGDAKRGDIGNTSEQYAKAIFNHFNFDASTLNPYMGFDSISPFIEFKNKLNFILALTSNPGSSDFQKQKLESGDYLFQHVIKTIHEWNKNSNLGIVFGATQHSELESNMEIINNLPVLIPGVGAQGGDLTEVVKLFKKNKRQDYLINVSRSIIYSDSSENYHKTARQELLKLNNQISNLL